nr:proton-coupled folate transporter-like [Procambarus clarkii]XP_045611718.1 proton-coupled folate transporter-like [Procambarus clarkii]
MMTDQEHNERPLLTESNTDTTTDTTADTTTTTTSYCGGVRRLLAAITLEPAVFLYVLGFGLDVVFVKNLWVDKTCLLHFNFSEDICTNLSSGKFPDEQNAVHRQVTRYTLYCAIVQHVPAVVVVMVLGAWSDLRDRRLPILVPMMGYFLMALGLFANSYWWFLQPEILLLCFVPVGLTGAVMAIYMSVSAYISADSDVKMRTTRLSVVMVIVPIAATLGRGLALMLFTHSGYVAVFGTQSILCAVAIVYVMLRLKKRPEGVSIEATPPGASKVLEVLSPARLRKTVQVACRGREGSVRRNIFGHVAVIWLLVFTAGSAQYDFLYTRKKFSWNFQTYSVWSLVDTPLAATGTLVVLPVLSYRWKVGDSLLGFVGAVSMIFNFVLRATAPESWILYLASVVGVCSGMVVVCSRAAISKLVNKDELGAVFALSGAGEAVIPIVSSAMMTPIYNATLDTFPGTVLVLAAGVSVIIAALYVWMMTSSSSTRREVVSSSIDD